jgi:hypothetical protein
VAIYEIVRIVALWNGSIAWFAQRLGPDWNMTYRVIPYVLGVVCRWAAVAASSGLERSRVVWVLAPLRLFLRFRSSAGHRAGGVLDIGFALNRVAIFSGVSIVLVGAFMLFEWAIGSWLQQQSHTTSLVVGAATAFVTDPVVLMDRTVSVLERHADASFARLAIGNGDGMPALAKTIR